MNRKGFTLVEVLAVIIILGLVLVVASPYIINAYNSSKLKSEEIFTNRLSSVIDSYVKLNSDKIGFTADGTANKDENETKYTVNISKGTITINNIIDENLITREDFVNAGNKEIECNKNAQVEIYKDSDYVYCYKLKKTSLNCLTEKYQNSITGDYVIDTCIWSR